MGRMLTRLRSAIGARIAAARAARPGVDHALRAKARYDAARGDRLAGAITYFAFLSVFPLIALSFAVLGYLVGWFPGLYAEVRDGIGDALPGLTGDAPGQINIDQLAGARESAGLLGLLGLLWIGTAWVDALRESLRSMWSQPPVPAHNVVVRKGIDVVVLVLLGLAVLGSLAISSGATLATDQIVEVLGLPDAGAARWGVRLAALGVGVASSALLIGVVFWRLSGMRIPRFRLFEGALLGGIAFEALKTFATYLLSNTMRNPVYATFSVAVGLLVWINLVSRAVLIAAAWTASEPYSDATVGEPRSGEPEAETVLDSEAVPLDEPAPAGALARLRQRVG